jgi:hypothetical protein
MMLPRPTAIFRPLTPQQAELLRLRAELAALRAKLAARESELAHLRAQLLSFKGRYIRQVGVLYIQLDNWEDRIAELNSTPSAAASEAGAPEPALSPSKGLASETWVATTAPNALLDLKSLFREVAKRIHPDFARNYRDAQLRTYLMTQANDAYLRNDAAALQRMLNGHDASTEPNTLTADLAQARAQIQQAATDIAAINAEIETLTQSEMAQLQQRSIAAATKGQDLLADLAARVKGRISLAMRRYEFDVARLKRNQAPFDPNPLLSAETPDPASNP